ncbi:glycosyltransferase family protein [Clostridium tagluense]|uniref:hypothetical protein n=1 Tax=Clostridium tagluense TaxID=360422 RepID=UPI001CF3FBD1|nr:hypothetical protein [Clostridium tagluense]MCB2297186.1 hypothetical protein [Clostridium tagluense]
MNKKIMLFSRDPGGANTVAPLYGKLKAKGYDVKLFGKDSALNKYRQYGLDGIDIEGVVKVISQEEINNFLISEKPDFLITGTSADDFTEKYLWKAAEKLNIKSFAILDQWVNYGIRFSAFSVNKLYEYEKNRKHPYLPFKILVMDEYAKEQTVKEGIEENRILVSGQPYFDYLIGKQENFQENTIKAFIDSIGCNENEFLITFVSEPISNIYNESDNSEHYWGYTERTIFKHFFNVLKNVVEYYKKKVRLIIRLHPKENENNYNDIIDLMNSKYISILVDRKIDGFKLMNASHLICGMSSMFLIEAAVIGKSILSIQIGLKKDNPFILHNNGIAKSILSVEELNRRLRQILIENKNESYTFELKKAAVENIINYMEAILCQY